MKKTIYLRKLIVGILPFLAMVGLELHVQAAETLQNVTTSHTHTAECEYHTHSSSCYHVHDASCYTNYVQHTASDEMVYDSCGCRHQTHYWHCNYCGRDWSSTTNNSADCREGHVLSDNGNSICHSNIFTCTLSTSDVLCGKSEGYLCGINDSETHVLSVDNSLDSYASTYTFSIASTAATTLDSSTPYIFSYSNTDGNVYSQSSTESSFTVDSGMGCGTLSVQLMEIDGNYVSLGNYNLSMDVTAPDIISLVPDCTGWTKGTVTITVNASDDASGVAGYSMDGTSWQGENTFTVSANSTYTFYARDAAGNVSAGSSITVSNIDTVPPTLLGLSPDSTDWTNGTVTITVSASDNASGASWYSMDGINWQLENTFTVSANSTYTFYARDAAGNVSAGSSITVSNIDTVPPALLGLSPDSTDWTNGTVTVTVSASDDASGVTGYSMDGTNWQGENTFTIGSNGTYTFFARDAVGNISAGSSITISNIDATPPVISGLSPDSTDWTNGTVTITVSASDDASGVAGYSMDGTNWQGENTFTISTNGTYTFFTRDAVGNISAGSSITVSNIDTTPPVISGLSPDSTDWTNGTVTITVSASDDASGVTGYSMDGTSWRIENTFTVSTNGTYTFFTRDAVGNISAGSSITIFNIDTTPPVISGLSPDSTDWTNGTVTITVSASDDASGVAGYSMDGANWQSENTFAVSINGTYTFYVRDAAGNVSTESSITIDNIGIDITDEAVPFMITPIQAAAAASAGSTGSGVVVFIFFWIFRKCKIFDSTSGRKIGTAYIRRRKNIFYAKIPTRIYHMTGSKIEVVFSKNFVKSNDGKPIDIKVGGTFIQSSVREKIEINL